MPMMSKMSIMIMSKLSNNFFLFYYYTSMTQYFTGMFHADVGIMYNILEEIEFYSGTERQNMIRHKNDGSMGSMLYGYTWKGYLKRDPEGNMVYRTASGYPGLYKTKVMDVYPHLEYVFKEFQELYFPEFNYTSVQCNKNSLRS